MACVCVGVCARVPGTFGNVYVLIPQTYNSAFDHTIQNNFSNFLHFIIIPLTLAM